MVEQTIVCPKYGERIPISKALTHQIERELRGEFEAEAEKRERERPLAFHKTLAAETATTGTISALCAQARARPLRGAVFTEDPLCDRPHKA